jgi:hypothetical protein
VLQSGVDPGGGGHGAPRAHPRYGRGVGLTSVPPVHDSRVQGFRVQGEVSRSLKGLCRVSTGSLKGLFRVS